ncbi:MAG: hypothetical protein Q8R83_05920 [Legionellaceae bacterium]|nr:hypothetical protein [Legionellaceae bacterium]
MSETEVEAVHNKQFLKFNELPHFAYEVIKIQLNNANATMCEMRAYALRVWGGLDREPDIDENGNPGKPEYVPGLSNPIFDSGKEISPGRLRVLQLIHLSNDEIANILFLSPHTVARHCQDLFDDSGINSRTELGFWAKNKGII